MAEPLVTQEKFIQLTGLVIDHLEGGYYHPDMKKKMSPANAKKMGDSGETMFGIDRKHGTQLKKYPEWNEFWTRIDYDRADNPTNWKHYYRGGAQQPILKELCAKLMYQWFTELSKKYITHEAAQAIANDDRLIVHFSYAAWNGSGWFQRFAKVVNDSVKAGQDKETIWKSALDSRLRSTNSIIRQQAQNMHNNIISKMS